MEENVEEKEPIHLFVKNPESVDATMPIRWCLCPKTLEEMKKRKALNPQLLIVVARGTEEVHRRIVPLDKAMDYLTFRRLGRYTIIATVLWHEEGNTETLRKVILAADNYGNRELHLLDEEGTALRRYYGACLQWINSETTLDVVVPGEFFAKEPPAWLKRWANLWFETAPRDQCQLRRRCILAFTVQSPVMLFWLIARSISCLCAILVLLLHGTRGINFRPLLRPFMSKVEDIWSNVETSVFFSNKKRRRRTRLLVPFVPSVNLPIFSAIYIVNLLLRLKGKSHLDFSGVLMVTAFSLLGVFLICCLIEWARKLANSASASQLAAEREEALRIAKQKEDEAFWQEYEKQFSDMICVGAPLEPSLEALPKSKRTLYLRFMGLKAKVCMPFQR